MHFDEFTSRLRNVRKIGKGLAMASCPAHKDQTPSLRIVEGHKQPIVLTCYAGCTPGAIVEALGLTFSDLCADRDLPIGRGMAQPGVSYRTTTAAIKEQTYLAIQYLKAADRGEIDPGLAQVKLLEIVHFLEKAIWQL